jgi:hypothetical protein
MNNYKSEAGHWYDHDGKPMYTIVGANGKERNTTLRDAKKEGLVPSVTTIIGIAAKPSKIHAQIEKGFLGGAKTKPYKVIKSWLDANYPNEQWIAEDSFCANEGYGGKIDLYSKSGIFIDFKTKDNLKGKDSARLVYDEHGMQLSAYAQGCNIEDPERISIFVDRADTELVLTHVWDKETHYKHKEMFNSLLNYWKLVKNYDSTVL